MDSLWDTENNLKQAAPVWDRQELPWVD